MPRAPRQSAAGRGFSDLSSDIIGKQVVREGGAVLKINVCTGFSQSMPHWIYDSAVDWADTSPQYTVSASVLKANDPHQRMAGEEYRCQDANYRHSAAWDCSHLRFIAICDSAIRRVAILPLDHCRMKHR